MNPITTHTNTPRFRDPVARDLAWGRYYRQRMKSPPLAGFRPLPPEARTAIWECKRLLATRTLSF